MKDQQIVRSVFLAALLWPCLALAATEPAIRAYLEINGKEVNASPVQISRTSSRITVRLRASRDGAYSFGISLSTDELSLLDHGMTRRTCASLSEPTVVRYPYDWTTRDTSGNIMSSRPRLIMPGLKVNGEIYVADTHELFSVKLDPCTNGKIRALMLAQRFYNDGGDRANTELHLRAGETREFTVRIYSSIEAVNRDRFGAHDQTMHGNMTELAFLEYAERAATENDTFFGPSGRTPCCRALTADEWDLAARKMEGVIRYVIIREQQSSSWIPPIFHKRGELVYHYQYLGALRRWTPEVTPEIERDFALRDVKGQVFASPHAPDGNWLQVDVRRPEVRAVLVENARAAVRHGFDGIFLDGYPFWADATGDVGGNVPSATHSWAYARWLLLKEIKEAMRAENPKATLGILTNQYYDSLGLGDWGMKEFMYGSWYSDAPPSGNDIVGHYRPATGTQVRKEKDRAYEEMDAPYQPFPIAYGAKGFSSVAFQSMLHFIVHPSGLYYADSGTFPIADMEKYMDTLVALFKQDDLYLTNIDPPDCWVRFPAPTIMQTDGRCAVKFSRPVCVTELPDGKRVGGVDRFTLEPHRRFELSRECDSTH